MADTGAEMRGLEQLQQKLRGFPSALSEALKNTEDFATSQILADQGGGHPFYPPTTAHNSPPAPYYERYVGEYMPNGMLSSFSQRMGDQFSWMIQGLELHIRNAATYAAKVIGANQDSFFSSIGWLKLIDVGRTNLEAITFYLAQRLAEAWRKK